MRKLILLSLFSLLLAPVASQGAPIAVNCPNTPATDDREFTITTDPDAAICHDYGNDPNDLNGNQFDVMVIDGWSLIDKDNSPTSDPDNGFFVDGLGGISGTFSLAANLWTVYDDIAIGFIVGGGQIDPKWAVFLLPEGETSGSWWDVPQQGGGLSHGVLYGRGTPDDPGCTNPAGCDPAITEVPEPATLLLLGSGLTFAARRRRAKR